jgi:hypothetical protein
LAPNAGTKTCAAAGDWLTLLLHPARLHVAAQCQPSRRRGAGAREQCEHLVAYRGRRVEREHRLERGARLCRIAEREVGPASIDQRARVQRVERQHARKRERGAIRAGGVEGGASQGIVEFHLADVLVFGRGQQLVRRGRTLR